MPEPKIGQRWKRPTGIIVEITGTRFNGAEMLLVPFLVPEGRKAISTWKTPQAIQKELKFVGLMPLVES